MLKIPIYNALLVLTSHTESNYRRIILCVHIYRHSHELANTKYSV